MKKGYLKISRKITEWEFWQNPVAVCLWVHLLFLAEWRTGKELQPGELVTSIRKLTTECRLSPNTIKTYLDLFERSGQISIEYQKKGMKISILKFEEYQFIQEKNRQGQTQKTGSMADRWNV